MALAPTINMAFIELLCLSRLRRTDELTPEEFAKYKQLSLRDATADAATAPPPSRSPRQGRGRNVVRQEFWDNCPHRQPIEHTFRGRIYNYTATAVYIGDEKFRYVTPDGTIHEGAISAFPRKHVQYLIDNIPGFTGCTSRNGWRCCNLPGRPKGDWSLDHLTTTG